MLRGRVALGTRRGENWDIDALRLAQALDGAALHAPARAFERKGLT
jgi:hypothetical protein